ncbi:MAG: hypothetical protein KY468_20650 [Armatimonadetes bacterium]|nr:hypothetical protein [Armatimonadota bacterium]
MTPDNSEPTTPEAPDAPAGDATAEAGTDTQEAPPMNRAERRAQAKGKKGPAESGHLAGLRQNNVQGKGKTSGGGSKTRFMRKV